MTPLDQYQKRLIVFLSVATFFEGYDFFALAQLLPTLRAEFGLSKTGAGLLLTVVNFGTVLAAGLVRLADRWGRRRGWGGRRCRGARSGSARARGRQTRDHREHHPTHGLLLGECRAWRQRPPWRNL